ncbi:MAG: hypothetical protein ACTSPN_14375 [Promethearchaeota archaeon]
MLDEHLTSHIIDRKEFKTEIVKKYTLFLSQYPEIFSDLISGSIFDFAIYDSLESYDNGSPIDIFNVLSNGNGIEIKPGKTIDADLELALSVEAVEKLIKTKDKEAYALLLGSFFNEPDEENGWIDFMLHKRTQILLDMGYGRFARAAGILEDEYSK